MFVAVQISDSLPESRPYRAPCAPSDVFPTFSDTCSRRIVVEQCFVESNAQIDVAEVSDPESSTSNRLSSGIGCFLQPFSERPIVTLKQLRSRERNVEPSLGLPFFRVVQRAIDNLHSRSVPAGQFEVPERHRPR